MSSKRNDDIYGDVPTSYLLRSLFHRSINQPGVRALILLISLVTLYTIYGSFNFYRDPLSVFFSEEHGYDRFYSAQRQAEADEFINAATANPDLVRTVVGKSGRTPSMCATFITVGRTTEKKEQFVDSAVGSFLANMSRAEREDIHLKIFFADVPNPGQQHHSYASLTTAEVADETYTYKTTLPNKIKEFTIKNLVEFASNHQNPRALEKKNLYDYAHALSRCIQTTNAQYIAILEDDVLLADGWAARTLINLKTVEAMMRDPMRRKPERGYIEPGRPNSWLYLRMFNQERSFGWAGGDGFWSNNVHKISFAISIPLCIILLVSRRYVLPRRLAKHIDGWVIFLVCGVSVPLFLWLFYASGKASLLGSPPGVHEEFFGCCGQALVYNRAHAQALADYMTSKMVHDEGGSVEHAAEEFAWNWGLARLSGYPMVAQHLSLTEKDEKDHERIWSMEFESQKPWRLADDHVSMVGAMYGEDAMKRMMDGEEEQ